MFLAFDTTVFIGYLAFKKPLISDNTVYFSVAFGLALLTLINIFLFKNRKLQININKIICLALIALLGFSIYQSGFLSGENTFSKKDIKFLTPVISIVFLLIANKYIKQDEKLVKSIDRIR
jgi:phosphoglycerol transferase MdoB-like AlkP superfamily enzyme